MKSNWATHIAIWLIAMGVGSDLRHFTAVYVGLRILLSQNEVAK